MIDRRVMKAWRVLEGCRCKPPTAGLSRFIGAFFRFDAGDGLNAGKLGEELCPVLARKAKLEGKGHAAVRLILPGRCARWELELGDDLFDPEP